MKLKHFGLLAMLGVLLWSCSDDSGIKSGDGNGQIRANLIEKNNIDAIIGLPANIFFGTGIPTLIMVLKKNRGNEGVLIIDASKGFIKDGKQNKLRACDVKKIVVLSSLLIFLISLRKVSFAIGSSPIVGSSKNNIFGLCNKLATISHFILCPKLKLFTG